MILDYNDLDLRVKNGRNKEYALFLSESLKKADGNIQTVNINFGFFKEKTSFDLTLFDDFSQTQRRLTFFRNDIGQNYNDNSFSYLYVSEGEKRNLKQALSSTKLSEEEKLKILNVLNISMFYQKYEITRAIWGTKKQEDYVISKFYPYFDFTRPLEDRVNDFLQSPSFYPSLKEILPSIEKAGLLYDDLLDGKRHEYGSRSLAITMNPIDLRSFVDSWNKVCDKEQKIELINCPEHDPITFKNAMSSLLDLGNDFYDGLKKKDDNSIAIEEI